MATKSEVAVGPAAMTDGYSMNGSQANSVARNPGGNLRAGNRFSVCGPVRGSSAPPSASATTMRDPIARMKRRAVTGNMLPRWSGYGHSFLSRGVGGGGEHRECRQKVKEGRDSASGARVATPFQILIA